jgi:hypothetical protein
LESKFQKRGGDFRGIQKQTSEKYYKERFSIKRKTS